MYVFNRSRRRRFAPRQIAVFPLCLVFVIGNEVISGTEGRHICVDLTAKFATASPDGVVKEIITINDQFPGPTIRARIGDTLTIRVHNRLLDHSGVEHSTSVHFHGIEMRGTPWFDGPEQVAQCPIPFNSHMVYVFELKQSGTYWYHSHHAWQYVDGFWGLLIVENSPSEVHRYDDELILTLNDWHWKSGAMLSKILHLPRNTLIPEAGHTPIPDSALINGRGNANCPQARAANFECDDAAANLVTVFDVAPWKVYRVRVINTSARAAFNFSIDGHFLRTIEVDGVDTVEVSPVEVVTIWPAQRYSFLVTMVKPWLGGNSWIRTDMIVNGSAGAEPASVQRIHPLAALHYLGATPQRQRQLVMVPQIGEVELLGLASSYGGRGGGSASQGGGSQGRPASQSIQMSSLRGAPSRIVTTTSDYTLAEAASSSAVGHPSAHVDEACHFDALNANGDKSQKSVSSKYFAVWSFTNQNPAVLDQQTCIPIESAAHPETAVPHYYDIEYVLNATFRVDQFGFFRAFMNGVSYNTDRNHVPAFFRAFHNQVVPKPFVPQYTPQLYKVVQLVINNVNDGAHPWHLHGHTFWVLGTGQEGDGAYNPARDFWKLNYSGLRRDTTHTPRMSWTVVRYVTDNPGVWLMHCHINWHLELGLGALFIEGQRELQAYFAVHHEARRVCKQNGVYVP